MSRTRPTRSWGNYPSLILCDRFDRVSDFKWNLAIVAVSAHTGEGIPDLLLMMIGLAQRYTGDQLRSR